MKLLQLVRMAARVLLIVAGAGVAAVGTLQLAPWGCSGPTHQLQPNGLTKATASAVPTAEIGRVVRVLDGDTYEVLFGGVNHWVRLLGVDAPELDQPYGQQASDSVAQLLGPQQLVWVTRRRVDLYGRTLVAVRLTATKGPGMALDSLLVVRGWAWAWDPKRRVATRAGQQAAALAGRRGLWKCGAGGVLMPKQWRQFNYKNKRRYGVGCTW